MKPFLWMGLLSLAFLAGCGDSQAGTSTQTENHLGMRILPVDSILPGQNPTPDGATVSTLRLEAANFVFSQADSLGLSLSVERLDGTPIPFQTVFWDRAAALGRIKVRIDSALRSSHSSVVLRWNKPPLARSDSQSVWHGFSAQQILLLNSTLVDDFEDGQLRTILPDSATWSDSATANAKLSNFGILPGPAGRSGKALHFTYSADSIRGEYVLIKTPLATSPRCLRSMDSLVLWVRGQGVFTLSLENASGSAPVKAWNNWSIDSAQWRRISVGPKDFLDADNKFGNVGWAGVRDSISHLTLFMTGTGELWLDDIRIYGVSVDDFR